jgi:hypothetical protein
MRVANGWRAGGGRFIGAVLILLVFTGCAGGVGGQANPTATGTTFDDGSKDAGPGRPSVTSRSTAPLTSRSTSTTTRSTSSSRTTTPSVAVTPSRTPSAATTTRTSSRASTSQAGPVSSFGVDRWIRQGWIHPFDQLGATTFDFTQLAANGQETVEVRAWQKVGSLDWQSNQLFSYAAFTVSGDTVTMTSTTGYRDTWTVTATATDRITINSTRLGNVTVFNCTATVWPDLIRASNRGCR